MSRGTSEAFFDVVEWAAEQEWSSGKVGLLGISYYAGSQWRVAARRPKGLAAIVPWEGEEIVGNVGVDCVLIKRVDRNE
jgi:predicted acyl esterase